MSSLESNDTNKDILQYKNMSSGHAHVEDCTTELRFTLRRITLHHHYLPAFVAVGTPFAFHLAPDERHYCITDLSGQFSQILQDANFDHYQECEMAIALFCQAQEVTL